MIGYSENQVCNNLPNYWSHVVDYQTKKLNKIHNKVKSIDFLALLLAERSLG